MKGSQASTMTFVIIGLVVVAIALYAFIKASNKKNRHKRRR